MAREVKPDDQYRDRLLKLIPSEFVGVHLFAQSLVPADHAMALLIVDAILLVAMLFYLPEVAGVGRKSQVGVTMGSFVVWLYSIPGSPFDEKHLYLPWLAPIALALWTGILAPIFVNPKPAEA